MDNNDLTLFKQHLEYDEWAGTTTLTEELLVMDFFLDEEVFPGWQVSRIHENQREGARSCFLALWERSDKSSEELFRFDVFECKSRLSAHELIGHLLAEFQTTDVIRKMDLDIGDVVFTDPDQSVVLFSRANLVVLTRDAGLQHHPVAEVARRLDESIKSKSSSRESGVVPSMRRFVVITKEPSVGDAVVLEIEAVDPLQRPVWFKFFARSGELSIDDDRVIYRPAEKGAQEIEVFAVNANYGMAHEKLEIVVK